MRQDYQLALSVLSVLANAGRIEGNKIMNNEENEVRMQMEISRQKEEGTREDEEMLSDEEKFDPMTPEELEEAVNNNLL